jgi:hypothetical protein
MARILGSLPLPTSSRNASGYVPVPRCASLWRSLHRHRHGVLGTLQGTRSEHSVNTQWTFSEHSGNTQWTTSLTSLPPLPPAFVVWEYPLPFPFLVFIVPSWVLPDSGIARRLHPLHWPHDRLRGDELWLHRGMPRYPIQVEALARHLQQMPAHMHTSKESHTRNRIRIRIRIHIQGIARS